MTESVILSVVTTIGSKLRELPIVDGQLIFVRDRQTVAMDMGGIRKFYNEIIELETEAARASLLAPVSNLYYFVVETAVLWTYRNDWVRITTPPQEIVSIGNIFPTTGSEGTLYVHTQNKEISVWDNNAADYVIVADKTTELSAEEVTALFND